MSHTFLATRSAFQLRQAQVFRLKADGFVKNPISALRFIPQSLRRTLSTPHSAGIARLELGLFAKPSIVMTFFESIKAKG
jgi:hypothetical protein